MNSLKPGSITDFVSIVIQHTEKVCNEQSANEDAKHDNDDDDDSLIPTKLSSAKTVFWENEFENSTYFCYSVFSFQIERENKL